MNNHELISKAKTLYHPDVKVEWLIWQLAIALEEALEELNRLKSNDNQ